MTAGLRRALLALLSIVFALLIAEAALRVLGLGGPAELGPFFDREEVHYFREKPWKDGRVWATGPYFRLAVIGDSFTVGQGVSWMDSYPHRLQALMNLNASTPPVALEVFAQNGMNTAEEVRFLQPALNWGADLVVLGVFLNDSEHGRDPEVKRLRNAMLPQVPEGALRSVLRSFRLLNLAYRKSDTLRRRRLGQAYADHIYDPDYQGWRAFEAGLDAFVEKTAAAGVPLVAVLFPYLAGVEDKRTYSRIGHDRMGQALRDRDIITLDLLAAFAGKSSLRMEAYPGVDGHPSEIGHRIAARAIFDFLLDGEILDESFRPRSVRRDRTRRQWLRQMQRYRDATHFEPRRRNRKPSEHAKTR